MVKGIDLFRERLGAFSDSYIVIGGTACDLAMEGRGGFRATKDIDMIVVTENVDANFAKALHGFLREGQYECYVSRDKRPHYYRFRAPKGSPYPFQIEMLSHSLIPEREDARFTPIALDEGIRSLSAIVLDPVYYEFAKTHRDMTHGLPCLTGEALIVFKSAAYLNLREDREKDPQSVRSEDMNKHRNDVFRLLGGITVSEPVALPEPIRMRVAEFIGQMGTTNPEWPDIEAAVGPFALTSEAYVEKYRALFGIER